MGGALCINCLGERERTFLPARDALSLGRCAQISILLIIKRNEVPGKMTEPVGWNAHALFSVLPFRQNISAQWEHLRRFFIFRYWMKIDSSSL